jgi:hypothetical protein
MHVMPPITVLFHLAMHQKPINVAAVTGHAVTLAPALSSAPVRAIGIRPMRCNVIACVNLLPISR